MKIPFVTFSALVVILIFGSACTTQAVAPEENNPAIMAVGDQLDINFIQWDVPHTQLTMLIPDGWVSEYYRGVTTFAPNSQNLFYSPSQTFEGALVDLFVSDGPRAVGSSFDVLKLAQDYVSDQPNITQPPTLVEQAGRQIVTTIYLNKDSKGKLITYLVGFVVEEMQLAVFISATPTETEAFYLPILNRMLNSIEVVTNSD